MRALRYLKAWWGTQRNMMKRILCAAFVAAAFFVSAAEAQLAKRHMIATASTYASEAGREILRAGGSAVDAAVAAQMVLTLTEPQSSGIGGGAFLIVAEKSGALRAYDGREAAPASAHPRMFLDAAGNPRPFMDAVVGGLSVGVPGNIAVLAKAHYAHGRLAWARLFQPAIRLAERGFKVPRKLAAALRAMPSVAEMPGMRALYFHADGSPLAEGQTLRNPAYANALRQIAAGGPDVFYKGAIANHIAAAVSQASRNPAPMTLTDLANYRAKDRTPLCAFYRRYRVCSVPPPAGGVVMLQILALLERFPSRQLEPQTPMFVHLMSEASRLAYADRMRWLGDPGFVRVPTLGLLDAGYVRSRAKLIDPSHTLGPAEAGTPPMRHTLDFAPQAMQPEFGTSHLSAVDGRGQVVSMTTTVENVFGSHLVVDGFILNNELTDFAFVPEIDGRAVANAPAAGKRPLSSMSPAIIFGPDGKFFAAVGSKGGRNIISYVAQTVLALIDGRARMQDAVSFPRHVNQNGNTRLEKGTALEALANQLTVMGHTVDFVELESGTQGILRVKGGYEGGADPRRDGAALGD
jgi:gamma-glutamyltranspeptidase/glutathione hydrolase